MDIVSKFMVASEESINDLFFLKKARYKDMYGNIVRPDQLNPYIDEQLDYGNAVRELNNFNNQTIIVYFKNEPAGFALIQQTAGYPEALKGKRTLNYSCFYILSKYDNNETRDSLWQKCLSAGRMSDAVWIEALQSDPFVPFLEDRGFEVHERSYMLPFEQPSYILIQYKSNIR